MHMQTFKRTLLAALVLFLVQAEWAYASVSLPSAPDLMEVAGEFTSQPAVLAWQQGERSHQRASSGLGLSLLTAAFLPGVDPALHGYYGRAAVLALVEIGGFLMVNKLNQEGDDLDREFHAYAEEHWNYARYVRDRMVQGEYAMEEGFWDRGFSSEDLVGLSEAEIAALYADLADDEFQTDGGRGSHILPGYFSDGFQAGDFEAWDHFHLNRTQQFYEMIGKYGQFQRGWEGYGADHGFEFAPQMTWDAFYFPEMSQTYDAMRDRSNAKLIAADRLSSLIFLNHLASLVEVLLRHSTATDLQAEAKWLGDPQRPVAGLQFKLSIGAN
jgi:hypothetical protein